MELGADGWVSVAWFGGIGEGAGDRDDAVLAMKVELGG